MSKCRYDINKDCKSDNCITCILTELQSEIQSLRGASCYCSDGIIDDIEDMILEKIGYINLSVVD